MKNITLIVIIISITALAFVLYNNRTSVNTRELNKGVNLPTTTDITDSTVSETEEIFELKVEKPASFARVEMITHQSPHGFEITYPKAWQKNAGSAIRDDNSFSLTFSPDFVIPEEERGLYDTSFEKNMINPLFLIEVSKDYYKTYFNLEEGENWVLLNNQKGIYFTHGGVHVYSFFGNDHYYSIRINSRAQSRSNTTEDEALWVLSTFKIIDLE